MFLHEDKLQKLVEIGGFVDTLALIESSMTDAVCSAICMNADCSHSEDLKPDQDRGWCPECSTNSMKSALILAGLI